MNGWAVEYLVADIPVYHVHNLLEATDTHWYIRAADAGRSGLANIQ